MKQTNKILITCLLFISTVVYLGWSQPSGEIYHYKQTGKDTIDFGMAYRGDSLQTKFILRNTGTENLRILDRLPSFLIGKTPDQGDVFDFQEFNFYPSDFLPIDTIMPGEEIELTIQYKDRIQAPADTAIYPFGRKKARLVLGLMLLGSEETAVQKEYVLISRKTNLKMDAYENIINFDSVYINTKAEETWLVQNSTTFSISVDTAELEMLSPVVGKPEFSNLIEGKEPEFPVVFPKKFNRIPWQLFYEPKNTGADSAYFRISYKPEPELYPDSIIRPWVKLFGTGVFQKIELDTLHYRNAVIHGDTIDAGDVLTGDSLEFLFTLKNSGSIPLGSKDEYILESTDEEISSYFRISKPLINGSHLSPAGTDSIKIVFKPERRGEVFARYIIESDIDERNIRGAPSSKNRVLFILRGRGVKPGIAVSSDTIDFGNVVLSALCPSKRDTLFPVANTGNSDLKIKFAGTYPYHPNSPFKVEPSSLEIPYDSIKTALDTIKVSFSSAHIGEFVDTLLIVNSAPPPQDSLKVYLKAVGVPPVLANLRIPRDIRAKPGRQINVPVIVDSSRIVFARTFEDSISFNSTILQYAGYSTIGTASENAPGYLVNISLGAGGETLGISLTTPMGVYFLPRDTLITLHFNTYLGDRAATQISFTNPKFGDGICNNVLDADEFKNGLFTLDSVCGLNLKTLPANGQYFSLEGCMPNPAEGMIIIKYSTAFKTRVSVEIYNSYGVMCGKAVDGVLPEGTYEAAYDVSGFTPGVYYIRMRAGIFSQTKILTVSR